MSNNQYALYKVNLPEEKTYKIRTPNNYSLRVEKETNKIIFNHDSKLVGKHTKRYTKALLEAWKIMENSPYKNYKPIYLDPKDPASLNEFNKLKELYLHPPKKGAIAPWTKEEKAYYESLKTKAQRYKYLVIRSGLKSAAIDIPDDAIACADDEEKLKKYKYLFDTVNKNKGTANMSLGYLQMAEWSISDGILGNPKGFIAGGGEMWSTGLTSRAYQAIFLACQLGEKSTLANRLAEYSSSIALAGGGHTDLIREQFIKDFAKNPPYDEFGMLPYLDELIGVDFIFDINDESISDPDARIIKTTYDKVKKGKIKDPRDIDSTPKSRWEFLESSYGIVKYGTPVYHADIPNDWDERDIRYHINALMLEAKIYSITPPQGYPNAPYYMVPEWLDRLYARGRINKLINPITPAIDRYHFPQYLRDEIYAHARKIGLR